MKENSKEKYPDRNFGLIVGEFIEVNKKSVSKSSLELKMNEN